MLDADQIENWDTDCPSVLGIAGPIGSGKSTAAAVLFENGWAHVKFAGALKAMISALYQSAGLDGATIARKIEGDLKEVPCDILCGKTPRHAMQTLGTEWGRVLIGPDLWTGVAGAQIAQNLAVGNNVVVDDVRFENEVDTIRGIGGLVLGLGGPSNAPDHASEGGVVCDLRYKNDGSLAELRGFMAYTFLMRGCPD